MELAARRARVLETLGERAAMVLPAAPIPRVGPDLELRYRPDAEFYYLTGCTEPGAVAVFAPANDSAPFTLFVRPRDASAEQWTGARPGREAARERYGADAAFPTTDLESRLPKLLAGADDVFFRLGSGREGVERLIRSILIRSRKARQRKGRGPRALVDPGAVLDSLRIIKDEHEVHRIREAAEITAAGIREAAARVRPGAGEWEIQAALEAAFRTRGSDGPAFASIVASGPNAAVLHYVDNARRLRENELLLIDAGAAHDHYAGDISRTFPVSGRFNPAQRELYEIVLAARNAAVAEVRPGATVDDVHSAAVRALVEGFVSLGLLDGDPADLAQEKTAYKPFYPHSTSHWLGLDVHDPGDYAHGDDSRVLEPGMVLTIEPGLYLPDAEYPPAVRRRDDEGAEDERDANPGSDRESGVAGARAGEPEWHPAVRPIPRILRGTGIRIEDDVLVTEDGREVLTSQLPVDPDAIEAL